MDIDGIRDEIRAKDLEIISLISERIECACRIAEIKKSEGLPIRDPDVERKVIDRYIGEGRKRGISEDLMERLAVLLIEGSVEAENMVMKE